MTDQISEYDEVAKIKRECYTCGRKLYFTHLVYTFYMKHMEQFLTREILKEIWMNPIFILECCFCDKRRKNREEYAQNERIKGMLWL